ncbi:unnamed protein product [Knipowitschia caucasica]
MWQSVGLTLLVIVATLVCALLFMVLGWFVVWRLFLSKFKFLRELVGEATTPQPPETLESRTISEARTETRTIPESRTRPQTRQRLTVPQTL